MSLGRNWRSKSLVFPLLPHMHTHPGAAPPNHTRFVAALMLRQVYSRNASDSPMQIQLNGQLRRFDDVSTLGELLERTGHAARRVAVEVNGVIVPRSQHAEHVLASGDRVEIVTALGGG